MSDDSRKHLDEIFRRVNNGQIDEAEALCRDSLKDHPDDINMLGMLGAILLRNNQFDDAEKYLLKTIRLEPAFAKPHEDLGLLYMRQDEPGKAADFFRKAAGLDPGAVSALRGLAEASLRAGDREQAEAARRRYLELSPDARTLAEAEKLHREGNSNQAEAMCEELIKRDPGNVAALRMLAVIASDDERYVIAEELLRRIANLSTSGFRAQVDLARFLADRSRITEAVEILEALARSETADADVHLALADMLSIIGRPADALDKYELCLELSPDEPNALLGRGHMLRITGRRAEAIDSYHRCIARRPDFGDAWWGLASLYEYTIDDEELGTIQAGLKADSLSPESEVAYRFALARALEQRRDFDGAWEQYVLGNTRKRALVRYDPVETEVLHSNLRQIFSTEIFARVSTDTPTDKTPLFILGLPRSGSTLIEQILASHSLVEGCGELPYIIMTSNALGAHRSDGVRYPEIIDELTLSELTGLGRTYLRYAGTHCFESKPYFTDKMPANFSYAGVIKLILPHAKIIDVRRHPLATCIANYRQLFAQGKNQSYDLAELGEYYLQYAEIMEHWDQVMPGAVLHVQYEAVIADLETEVQRLLDYCGLPFEEACVNYYESERPVKTLSSEQVRQPIYDSAVEYWRNYEPHLDELKEILQPVLD